MKPTDTRALLDDGVVALDLRTPRPFAKEHLPGAVNIQFNRADLADRADMVLPKDQRYIVHAEPEPIARIASQILTQAGYDVVGHLEGGLAAWKAAGQPTESLDVMSIDELRAALPDVRVLDVREGFEYRHAHVPDAINISWTEVWERWREVPTDRRVAVVCGDEVRSAAAASILKRAGLEPALVLGGMVDWLEEGYRTEKTAKAVS